MAIYTAQYRYKGPDRVDITAKTSMKDWKIFAPTWQMVLDYKRSQNEKAYIKQYEQILFDVSIKYYPNKVTALANILHRNDITFVCFCKSGAFCHRLLLADFFNRVFGIEYKGERPL